ncbi:MAG: cation:proton antiporter [Candidatus Thermoplasmatota archaeon]|nr:hypothetical protein [Euryarchaeota archaeon]MBU4032113.1 cation:proton antiporter [Candidatus Thermoplasmatota archaeon]MBU4071019.1 cation:proton antiporter [Candidatus Thermoplasmatota archaeon]MBU4144880.1 cation:proton antiporter [Candidatus Thermoplasmatota archaeon]MBU4592657.1 cation:proton antiporter [Candidatus Thermoplasmatota archaeon]
MEVSYLFAGIGMIILIGFLGSLFFERTKIPDILILIFIGLFIGPILTHYTHFGILDDPEMSSVIISIAPTFAALALVIILFDGGLNLHLEKTMKKLGLAILHTGVAFIGTMVITAIICFYFLRMDIIIGLLLGCIIGGTSGAVVIPIMAKSCTKESTKILLTLESVLTDVLCIVSALIFIEMLKGSTLDTGAMVQRLLSSFVLAGFIAFLFGVFWLLILKKLEGKPFAFMITIAALLVLYAVTEYIQVSGAIAALVFGLVLSNKDEIARILKIKGSFILDDHIKQFHTEVSFLVRTFFFVYLGMTFTFVINSGTFGSLPGFIPNWIVEQPVLVLLLLLSILFIGVLVVRYIATTVTCYVHKESKDDKAYIFAMLPRGLAAAVLAQLPFTIAAFSETTVVDGVTIQSAYYNLMSPYQNIFLNVAFLIIVLSVIATSIGVSVIERKRGNICPEDSEKGGDWAVKSPTYRRTLDNAEAPDKKVKPIKEGPKPWADPTPPHRTAKGTNVPKKAAPRAVTPPSPPRNKSIPIQAKPVKPAQTSRPPPQKSVPARKSAHPQSRTPHPLVKRAAESEKAQPRKTVEAKKKDKK